MSACPIIDRVNMRVPGPASWARTVRDALTVAAARRNAAALSTARHARRTPPPAPDPEAGPATRSTAGAAPAAPAPAPPSPGRRPAVSERGLPRVLRRRPGPAVPSLWRQAALRRRRGVLPKRAQAEGRRAVPVTAYPPVRPRPLPRGRLSFPPSVTVKDYTWGGSAGYMHPKLGAQPERFPTVIQIVPPPAAAR